MQASSIKSPKTVTNGIQRIPIKSQDAVRSDLQIPLFPVTMHQLSEFLTCEHAFENIPKIVNQEPEYTP